MNILHSNNTVFPENNGALEPLPNDDEALIRRADLPRYFPIAVQTWARWACEGNGPKYVKLGKRIVAYRVGDLRAWLMQQKTGGYI